MIGWLIAGGIVAATVGGVVLAFRLGEARRVPCVLDLEATHEHFHAHASLLDTRVNAGDEVRIHDAPTRIPLGTRRRVDTTATVRQAGVLRRAWVRLTGGTAIHTLYEVGFEG